MQDGNGLHEAKAREGVSRNASEGIEPRNNLSWHEGQGLHLPEAGNELRDRVSAAKRAGVRVRGGRPKC
jgi:hypothetical protein